MNRFLFHTVTPVTTVQARIYSETRNVLTDSLAAADTQQAIVQAFLQALVWLLINRAKQYLPETADEDTEDKKKREEEEEEEENRVVPLVQHSGVHSERWAGQGAWQGPGEYWAAPSTLQRGLMTPGQKPRLASIQTGALGRTSSLDSIGSLGEEDSAESMLAQLDTVLTRGEWDWCGVLGCVVGSLHLSHPNLISVTVTVLRFITQRAVFSVLCSHVEPYRSPAGRSAARPARAAGSAPPPCPRPGHRPRPAAADPSSGPAPRPAVSGWGAVQTACRMATRPRPRPALVPRPLVLLPAASRGPGRRYTDSTVR